MRNMRGFGYFTIHNKRTLLMRSKRDFLHLPGLDCFGRILVSRCNGISLYVKVCR